MAKNQTLLLVRKQIIIINSKINTNRSNSKKPNTIWWETFRSFNDTNLIKNYDLVRN